MRGGGVTALNLSQFGVTVHPDLGATTVWGYTGGTFTAPRSTYLGPTLVAMRGTPVNVTFSNQLPATPLFPTDPALVPPGAANSRINTHLHGMRVLGAHDGNPFDAYSNPVPAEVAPGGSQTQSYPNAQGGEALTWYHDHALGITRTNVYAGLAGGYLITEPDGSPHAAGNVPTALDPSGVPDPYAPGATFRSTSRSWSRTRTSRARASLGTPSPGSPSSSATTAS